MTGPSDRSPYERDTFPGATRSRGYPGVWAFSSSFIGRWTGGNESDLPMMRCVCDREERDDRDDRTGEREREEGSAARRQEKATPLLVPDRAWPGCAQRFLPRMRSSASEL